MSLDEKYQGLDINVTFRMSAVDLAKLAKIAKLFKLDVVITRSRKRDDAGVLIETPNFSTFVRSCLRSLTQSYFDPQGLNPPHLTEPNDMTIDPILEALASGDLNKPSAPMPSQAVEQGQSLTQLINSTDAV